MSNEQMIEECLEVAEKLTSAEIDFLESIDTHPDILSDKQKRWLDDIYDRLCKSPY